MLVVNRNIVHISLHSVALSISVLLKYLFILNIVILFGKVTFHHNIIHPLHYQSQPILWFLSSIKQYLYLKEKKKADKKSLKKKGMMS